MVYFWYFIDALLQVYALFREENNQEIYSLKDLLGSVDQERNTYLTKSTFSPTFYEIFAHLYFFLSMLFDAFCSSVLFLPVIIKINEFRECKSKIGKRRK